jgi:cytosine/adenosine deaminase-related metal-dependent hydrolase
MTAREALEIATLGGAAVLGRDDIGTLAPGKCADFFALNLNRLDYAGALHDPVAAALFCAPQAADYTVVNGKFVVKNGEVVTVDMWKVVERHNKIAREMVEGG